MKKMIFIEPKAPNFHIFSQFQIPRLGSFILGTLMKQRGWDVEIIVEEICTINYEKIKFADIISISTITPTAPRAYAIADKIQNLGIPVIMGGPHVTFLPDEALRHADFVIRGEGETALMMFIDTWEKDQDFSRVPNLSYKSNNTNIHNPQTALTKDLDTLPFPDFSLLQGKLKKIAGKRIIPMQTSRGCPFDCSFCSVTGMFGKKYRYRSTENIMQELRLYNSRKNFLFFYDDNFTAHPARAKELLKAMIKEKLKFHWSTQVRVDIAKDIELVRLMKKAGCHTLFIGFESVNPESLKEMKKKQTLREIIKAIKILRKNRIHIHGMFVYGFDSDNWQTVRDTVNFAKKAKLTSTQFLLLTPLPGSELYNTLKAENRIKFDDWSLYDTHHVVFVPRHFSLSELQYAQIFSHKNFYSWFEIIKKLVLGKWVDLSLAYYARHLNISWQRENNTFIKVLELLSLKSKAILTIDYKEKTLLEEERIALNS